MTPCITARALSKVFALHTATRRKGVSTEGASALRHLLRQIARRQIDTPAPDSGDARYLTALRDVSFDVLPGEVLGIIGRNGAGKSTLLKILARVLHPTAGHVAIHGRVVSMLELGVGFAPELTVRQNIQIHGRLAGFPAARIRAAEDEILDFAGLTAFADRPLSACPGGAAVQLGFAAVICLNAEIILADEVLAVGDAAFREACERRVRDAGTSGETVLFVSHDMAAIRRICTRVIWIDRGRIVRDGPTDEVVDAYTNELLAGHLLPPLTQEGLAGACTLVDTRLADASHAPVGAWQIAEPGYLECLVRVLRADVSATVEIELWRGKQLLDVATSQPLSARQPTTFRAGVRLPADTLNESPYQAQFRLRVTARETGETAVAAEARLEFAVMNPHPERSVWGDWVWGRGGLISPRLPWRVEVGGA